MTRKKINFYIAAVFAAFLFTFNLQAQTPPKTVDPSFDLVLQTIVGANDVGVKSEVSASLSNVVRKLKNEFPFADYRLASTFIQRVSNQGNAEFKSVSYTAASGKNSPIFNDWTISGIEILTDERGQESFQINGFRFGQKVPVVTSGGIVNYENVGLNTRFSLPKNTPTLVGSLTTSNPGELMFIVLTVKPTEK